MNQRMFAPVGTALLSLAALLVLLLAGASADAPTPAQAAPLLAVPTVTEVDPTSAPNDLETAIVVTGTGFTTSTLVLLGDAPLPSGDVGWVSATRLTATVPWGMVPGVYTVTVFNPGEGAGSLPNAFTVTQGLGVWTTGGPYGGDLVGIEKKPGMPTTVYALVFGVGLFVSQDAGAHWEPSLVNDWPTNLAFDAQDGNVIYYGSDEGFFRTMDGGDNWEVLSQIPATGDCYQVFPAAHPSSAGVAYVGIGSCAGIPFSPGDGGVFRSDDYGDTWITVTNGMTDTDVHSITIHPNDPGKMLAGTWDGNLYVSTDGGENWSLNAHLDGYVGAVYFNPYQPLEAWATTGTPTHDAPLLYQSTDLTTWTPVVVDASLTWGPFPNRWDLDFLPGEIWATSIYVYSSTNDGASWTPFYDVGANVIAITPDNPQEIYAAAGKGVRKSEDGGQSWRDINEGLAGLVPYLIAVPRTAPDSVYVKTRQGLLRSFNGGHAWQDLAYGGGGYPQGDYLVVDAYTPTRVYLGTNVQCTGDFCLEISTDAGVTWNLVTATLPVTYAGWESGAYALASHPQVPGRILAGNTVSPPGSSSWLDDAVGMVYASDDYGQSWTHIGPTQPISFVIDIAYDAVDPALVYMATQGSGLWRSTDGGSTWQAMPDPGGRSIIDEIAPHPSISGTLVIATSDDVHGAGLYSSQDAGETWTFLNSNVDDPLVYAPTTPPTLYGLGAIPQNRGLVRSVDNGQTWEQVSDAPYPTRLATGTDGERVMLYIGTPGGVVQIDLDDVLRGAGVYRWTSRLIPPLYLPLVCRGRTP